VVPVTAKHNLRIVQRRDEILIPKRATLNVKVGVANFVSEDLGWQPSQADEMDIREVEKGSRPAITLWGLDISTGKEISTPKTPLTDPAYAFDLVRTTFKLETEQRVGIAVNYRRKAKPTATSIKEAGPDVLRPTLSEQQIEDIYGKHDYVNIYTGKITYVGKDHIEYTCNTFTGCAGAIVFLPDQAQPNSVQRCAWGKPLLFTLDLIRFFQLVTWASKFAATPTLKTYS
jgi:hypothetical protein